MRFVHVQKGLFAVLALVASACAPSLVQLEAHNGRALAQANARVAAMGSPFVPAVVAVDDPASPENGALQSRGEAAVLFAAAGAHGLRESEHLVALRATGEMVFVGGFCADSGPCGACSRAAEYRYLLAPDGHVIVVRLRPEVEVVATHEDASCSAGCAGGTPDPRPAASVVLGRSLGISSADGFELRDEPYVVKIIDRVCTNTDPIP